MTKNIQFDKRITIGNLLSIITVAASVFIAYMNLNIKVAVMDSKQDSLAKNQEVMARDVSQIKKFLMSKNVENLAKK